MKVLLLFAIGCILACHGQPTADEAKDAIKDENQMDAVPVDVAIPQDEEVDAAITDDDEEVYDEIPQDVKVGAPIKQKRDAFLRRRRRYRRRRWSSRHVAQYFAWRRKLAAIRRRQWMARVKAWKERTARAKAKAKAWALRLAARAKARIARAKAAAARVKAWLAKRRASLKRVAKKGWSTIKRWFGKRDEVSGAKDDKKMEDFIYKTLMEEMKDEDSVPNELNDELDDDEIPEELNDDDETDETSEFDDETDLGPGGDYVFEEDKAAGDEVPEELKDAQVN